MDHTQEFLRICRRNRLEIDTGQFDLLRRYVELLTAWNARINLVSRRDVENIWFRHILHCVAPWFRVWIPHGRAVLDIGTGGGLPGLPLAILRSDLQILLLDSVQKKTKVLSEICSELGLPNVEVINGRAEDIGTRTKYALRFSTVLVRGVAPLVELIRWSRPFLSEQVPGVTGPVYATERLNRRVLNTPTLVAWKGGDLRDEIAHASRRNDQENIEVLPLVVKGVQPPGLDEKRLVLVTFAQQPGSLPS